MVAVGRKDASVALCHTRTCSDQYQVLSCRTSRVLRVLLRTVMSGTRVEVPGHVWVLSRARFVVVRRNREAKQVSLERNFHSHLERITQDAMDWADL